MGDRREKIKETIKKLIAHQQSADAIGNTEEALAFGAKVTELMREYRLERHEVEPSVIDAMDFTEYGATMITEYGGTRNTAPWEAILFNVIAKSHACEVVVIRETGHFFVVGQTVDRSVACALSVLLVKSIARLSRDRWDEALFSDPAVMLGAVTERAYVESYRMGFIRALQDRLTKEERASCDEHALIVLSRAVTRTSKYLATVTGGGATGQMSIDLENRHPEAALDGYSDGMRADLNTNRIGATGVPERKEIEG